MGRLAGPPNWRRLKPWKERVAERRQEIERTRGRPDRPLAAPSGMRRRMALLWSIASDWPDGLQIGMRNRPPFTPDMRWLVDRGYLRLARVPDISGRRRNMLRLGALGRYRIEGYEPPVEDRDWVRAAFAHGMLG